MYASNLGLSPCVSARQGTTLRLPASTSAAAPQRLVRRVATRASPDDEAELEKRLEKLRQVKGATPYGQGKAKTKETASALTKASDGKPKVQYDFSDEVVFYEGVPAVGDLVFNLALGTTLVWLPLTVAAIGRTAFIKYRFTSKRLSVSTTAPWRQETTQVAYAEVRDVVTVSRGLGLWGDMVVTLNNGDKVEIRSLDKFKELKEYILKQRDALAPFSPGPPPPPSGGAKPKGSELTAAELMGEPEPSSNKGSKKGFA